MFNPILAIVRVAGTTARTAKIGPTIGMNLKTMRLEKIRNSARTRMIPTIPVITSMIEPIPARLYP